MNEEQIQPVTPNPTSLNEGSEMEIPDGMDERTWLQQTVQAARTRTVHTRNNSPQPNLYIVDTRNDNSIPTPKPSSRIISDAEPEAARQYALTGMRNAIERRKAQATCKACYDLGTTRNEGYCTCERGRTLAARAAAERDRLVQAKMVYLREDGVRPTVLNNRWYDALKDAENIGAVMALEALVRAERRGVLLTGYTGTGKTFLACLAAVEYNYRSTEAWQYARYVHVPYFVQRLFGAEREWLTSLYHAPMLVIDDLGKEPVTSKEVAFAGSESALSFALSGIGALIDERERRELPTVITTNLSERALQTRYRDYVFGRLVAMCGTFVTLEGTDRRRADE